MNLNKIIVMGLLAFSLFVHALIGDGLDVKGVPNEDGHTITRKLDQESTTLDERFAYFTHYSPTVRFMAAGSMRKQGAEAMPYLIRGLQANDRHVVRASCDAISGVRGFFGVDFKPGSGMNAKLAAPAVPYIMPLLDRHDPYIQAGALQALSRCGKAVVPQLKKVDKLLDHDEWWVRVSAAYVLEGVGSPEADIYVEHLARAMVKEQHAMCLNHMTRSLKALLKTASTRQDAALVVSKGLSGMERDYIRGQGLDVLQGLGSNAVFALPDIDALISATESLLAGTEPGSLAAMSMQNDLAKLRKAKETISARSAVSP